MHISDRLDIADQFKLAGKVNEPKKTFIAFSPELDSSHDYAHILSKGMNDLRLSGDLAKILAKYGLRDWQ